MANKGRRITRTNICNPYGFKTCKIETSENLLNTKQTSKLKIWQHLKENDFS